KDDRLALIGDSDHIWSDSTDRNRITRREQRALEDFFRVVLHPAGLRVVLRDLSVASPSDATVGGDDQGSRARCALVDREHVLHRRIRSAKRRYRGAIL